MRNNIMYKFSKKNDKFKIVEKKSNGEITSVYVSNSEKLSKGLVKLLNSGHGFGGWTPDFFAKMYHK